MMTGSKAACRAAGAHGGTESRQQAVKFNGNPLAFGPAGW